MADDDDGKLSRIAQQVWHSVNDTKHTDPKQSTVPIQQLTTHGNQLLSVLHQGKEIWTEAANLIADAVFEVRIVMYIFEWRSDPVLAITQGLYRAIEKRQQNNGNRLIVRLVIDQNPLSFLDNAGLQPVVQWIRDVQLDAQYIDLQVVTCCHLLLDVLHSKYVLIDQSKLLITGDNLYDESNFNPNSWYDTGYVVQGPVVSAVEEDFVTHWNRGQLWYISQDTLHPPHIVMKSKLQSSVNSTPVSFVNGFPIIVLPKSGIPVTRFQDALRNPLVQGVMTAMHNAQHSLDIISPNINARPFLDELQAAVSRGVHVRLLTSKEYEEFKQNLPF